MTHCHKCYESPCVFERQLKGKADEVRSLTEQLAKITSERDEHDESLAVEVQATESLTANVDRLKAEVRSLTVERDAARLPEAERADLWGMIADRDRRLSRAREALAALPPGTVDLACMSGCAYREETPYKPGRACSCGQPEREAAWAALRAALAEPLGDRKEPL